MIVTVSNELKDQILCGLNFHVNSWPAELFMSIFHSLEAGIGIAISSFIWRCVTNCNGILFSVKFTWKRTYTILAAQGLILWLLLILFQLLKQARQAFSVSSFYST